MQASAINYPWEKEIEKVVVQSLCTSFGLDFLLFKDKVGGDVDTIHNARQNIYATDKAKQNYEQRGDYDSHAYHQNEDYIKKGREDKTLHQEGKLHDAYRNKTFSANDNRNLDHTISAKEIHDDPGRVLAGADGIELANDRSNLQSTSETINKIKKALPTEEFLEKLPQIIDDKKLKLEQTREALKNAPRHTPAEKHAAQELEQKIKKQEKALKELESVNPEAMQAADRKARAAYNETIHKKYYTSSTFLNNTGKTAAISGMKMGVRQVVGLVLAEVWFELRQQLPILLSEMRERFDFKTFIAGIKNLLQGIWQRVCLRFRDFLNEFKNGALGGALASLNSTLINIFATTQKLALKIIRESWNSIVKAVKLIFFNPQKLGLVDICKELIGIFSAAVSLTLGSVVNAKLQAVLVFPFGAELAAFAGALVTGLGTIGLAYFFLHSETAQKVWAFIEKNMPHAATLAEYQAANARLDQYLQELTKLEFNLNPDELAVFTQNLRQCNSEMERSFVLKAQAENMKISLPFDPVDPQSIRRHLANISRLNPGT